jgi:hypothetical protein
MTVSYLHLVEDQQPPVLDGSAPFKAVLVLEQTVNADWQNLVSAWLVQAGCLYMMAWGPECSSWDDSVDWANLAVFDYGDIPDDQAVMTTWHENEPLSEVFWFAEHTANHSTTSLERTLILHIGPAERESTMLQAYADAQTQTDEALA